MTAENNYIYKAGAKPKGGTGGVLPPAQLKQVQFALNRKQAFLMLSSTACLKTSSFHRFYVERQYHNITFDF